MSYMPDSVVSTVVERSLAVMILLGALLFSFLLNIKQGLDPVSSFWWLYSTF
jgi:hypothetical protein